MDLMNLVLAQLIIFVTDASDETLYLCFIATSVIIALLIRSIWRDI